MKFQPIAILWLILFNAKVTKSITCDVQAKLDGEGKSYQFEILYPQSWLFFDFCMDGISGCGRKYNLTKKVSNKDEFEYIDDCEGGTGDCTSCMFTNFTLGKYKVSGPHRTSQFDCDLSQYNGSVFMGCNPETAFGISSLYNYVPYYQTPPSSSYDITSSISCGNIIQGETYDIYYQYYAFTVLSTTKWITFDTCDETEFTPELKTYMFEGRWTMSSLKQGTVGSTCQTINITTVVPGDYYLGIGKDSGDDSVDEKNLYTIHMDCANASNIAVITDYNAWEPPTTTSDGSVTVTVVSVLIPLIFCIGFVYLYLKWRQRKNKEGDMKEGSKKEAKVKEVKEIQKDEEQKKIDDEDIDASHEATQEPGVEVEECKEMEESAPLAMDDDEKNDVTLGIEVKEVPEYKEMEASAPPAIDDDENKNDVTLGIEMEEVPEYKEVEASAPPARMVHDHEKNGGDTARDGESDKFLSDPEGGVEHEVTKWINDVVKLSGNGNEYDEKLIKNGFDTLEIIKNTLDMQALEEIGIEKLGHKKTIMFAKDQL